MELSVDWLMPVLLGAEEPTFIGKLLSQLWVIFSVAVGIGLVIFVHELGHFLAAKLFGVKVEKFYVGFDVPITILGIRLPRHFGRFRWGETEYGIGVIPLGGYVKMLGQDDDPRRAAEERERIQMAQANPDGDGEAPPTLDPRSYPAKSVWQRMVIISAGVVMNLITSVIFAAIAFGFGVPYVPAVIGDTLVGYPAWEANVEPGAHIVSVGDIKKDPKLSYEGMMTQVLASSYGDPEQPVQLQLEYPSGIVDVGLKPRPSSFDPKLRMVGFSAPKSNVLSINQPALPFSAAEKVLTVADENAEVVSVNGQELALVASVNRRLGTQIAALLTNAPGEDIRLTLKRPATKERTTEETAEVVLPPQPLKNFGVRFAFGEITSLVDSGTAKSAGLQVGDKIIAVDTGDQQVSALTLPAWFSTNASVGSEVKFTVLRPKGDTSEQLEISVPVGEQKPITNPVDEAASQIAVAQIGLAYQPNGEILSTTGGEESKLQAGDVVRRIRFELIDKEKQMPVMEDLVPSAYVEKFFSKGYELNEKDQLVNLMSILQLMPVGTKVFVLAERGTGKTVLEAELKIEETADFWYDRGLNLQPLTLINQADSVGEAFSLGFEESRRKFNEVLGFLKLLFTGRLGVNNIGGPVAITYMAGSAASAGTGKLLLFLTFLSVNLAILNFLPIPALDGGHMVFLLAEAARGKPVDEELQMKITMVGVLALLSLMVFVLFNDFLNLTGRS